MSLYSVNSANLLSLTKSKMLALLTDVEVYMPKNFRSKMISFRDVDGLVS